VPALRRSGLMRPIRRCRLQCCGAPYRGKPRSHDKLAPTHTLSAHLPLACSHLATSGQHHVRCRSQPLAIKMFSLPTLGHRTNLNAMPVRPRPLSASPWRRPDINFSLSSGLLWASFFLVPHPHAWLAGSDHHPRNLLLIHESAKLDRIWTGTQSCFLVSGIYQRGTS
jgi:hypothetical protein